MTSTRTGPASRPRTATSRSSAPSWPATRASPSSGSAGPTLLARCPDLLAVCSAGAGYDIIDVDACTAAGVIVCNNSGPGREAVAEHALGFMLALAKKIVVADRDDPAGARAGPHRAAQLGAAGQDPRHRRRRPDRRPAHRAVRAVRHDRARLRPVPHRRARRRARGAEKVELDELLERSDFVHLNCPLTPRDRGTHRTRAVRADEADRVLHHHRARSGARRGGAATTRSSSGAIAGAGIDVFHDEPPDPSHPLLALDNVVASPHTAGHHGRGDARHRASRPPSSGSRSSRARCRRACVNPEVVAGATPTDSQHASACGPRSCRVTTTRPSAKVRAQLDHPVIDADGHWVELFPIFFDYIAEVGEPGRRRQVPHPLRAPLPRLVRAHDRGATAAPARAARRTGACRSTCATAPPPRSRASSTTASTTGASTSPSCSRASGSPWAATSPTPS